MAALHVSPLGSNTAPYDKWAKAANQIVTAVTWANSNNPGGTPHIIYVAPGAYIGGIFVSGTWPNDAQILGTIAHGTTDAPQLWAESVFVVATTSYALGLNSNTSRVTVKNIALVGGDGTTQDCLYVQGTGHVIENVVLRDAGNRLIYGNACTNFTMNKCKALGAKSEIAGIQFNGSSSAKIRSSVVSNSGNLRLGANGGGVVNGAGTLEIDHCVITGAGGSAVLQNGTGGTTTVRSSVVVSGTVYGRGRALDRAVGTLVSRNNILVGRFTDNAIYGAGVDYANDIATTWPRLRAYSRKGWIIPRIDDTANAADVVVLSEQFRSRGVRGLFVISVDSEVYGNLADHQTALDQIKSDGIFEIGAHAYSHSDCSLTGAAMTVTKSGAVLDVDRAADEIRLDSAVVVPAFKSKTLAQIKAALAAAGCTVSNITANLDIRCLGEALDDLTAANITSATAMNLLIDATGASGYLKVEIADCKTLLESALGIDIYTFATPRGLTSAAAQSAGYAAGYESLSSSISASDREYSLLSMDRYRVSYIWAKDLVGANDAATRANTLRLCEWAATEGAIVHLISHENSETSPANWGVILDAMKEHKAVRIGSMHDAMTWMLANGWSVDGRTIALPAGWTEEYDFRLDGNTQHRGLHSGLVVAGVNDGAQIDPWGNIMLTHPNIGADQYDYAPGFGPWSTCDASLPTDGQVFKSHALPIAARKLTMFHGVASQAQINEAKE